MFVNDSIGLIDFRSHPGANRHSIVDGLALKRLEDEVHAPLLGLESEGPGTVCIAWVGTRVLW